MVGLGPVQGRVTSFGRRCVLGEHWTERRDMWDADYEHSFRDDPQPFEIEPKPWPVMFTLVPLAIGCAILVWVPILIPLWHWLRGW